MSEFQVLVEAREGIDHARAWYEQERPGLGDRFLEDVEECFAAIRANPARFGRGYRKYREGMLDRFPYIVYYTATKALVVVHRVVHSARDQDAILRELN